MYDVYTVEERRQREMRIRRNLMRQRKQRMKKLISVAGFALATLAVVLILTFTFGGFKSNANDSFKYFTYVEVQGGDTLWDMADRYMDTDHYKNKNEYIREICQMNHLEDENDIVSGNKLIFPYYTDEFVY